MANPIASLPGAAVDAFAHEGTLYEWVNSPDDGGHYIQRIADNATSQVFGSADQAWNALVNDIIEWEYFD